MAKRSRQAKRIQRVRWIAVGGVAGLVAAVAAIGLYYSLSVTPGEYREGQQYYTLMGTGSNESGPIVVTEFFSYGCVHCRDFDPQISAWAAKLPSDTKLVRSPVAFNSIWRVYAKMYYMAKELGVLDRAHERLFSDIHDRGRTITSDDQVREFFASLGVSDDRITRSLHSPIVAREESDAETRARADGISSVPTLMVADRYVIPVGEVGRLQALAIADHLIEKVRADRASARKGTAKAPTE